MDTQIKISKINNESTQSSLRELLYIANNDGSPRWIWPSDLTDPLFLSFYNSTTIKQKLITVFIKIVFALRLQKVIFSKYHGSDYESINKKRWALFTGTKGPHQKELKLSLDSKLNATFTKIPKGSKALESIANELKMLSYLKKNKEKFNFIFPEIIAYKNNNLSIAGITKKYQPASMRLPHFQALLEMKNSNEKSIKLADWRQWSIIDEQIKKAKNNSRISKFILEGLEILKASFDSNETYQFCLSHGDFTPWNCFETSDHKLAIIDWEMAIDYNPLGFDFFHFEFQNGILQLNKNWSEILHSIQSRIQEKQCVNILGQEIKNLDKYLKLYLLTHISKYLTIYIEQENWHEQVNWQLERWNYALAWASPRNDYRRSFIKQFFSQISNLPYGVLKLENNDPCALQAGSDLDILIQKADYSKILDQINRNPLVSDILISKKSFMSQLSIEFLDGSMLHLDFIWQLKRKAKTFLDAKDLISRSQMNRYDVKVTSKTDNAKYVLLFFSLNNQDVPKKYNYLFANASEGSSRLKDLIISTAENSADRKAYQRESLNALKENSGFKGLKNRVTYILDTIRTMYQQKGFIITFSGVDGAGKSTVIEEVKKKLNEKYRRPIKVLRHRPSILPILSAFIHGKDGAEKKSMESLPRKGGNKSTISSFLRFIYYYSDYLFGQLIINYKYIRRGHIVLYDRYYYDFINDAKRTNIQLNPRLIKFGFNFLIKPKYNYFLYASPEVILARKKELTKYVIRDLSEKYKSLFFEFQNKWSNANFISIENIDLDKTLSEIFSKITLKS